MSVHDDTGLILRFKPRDQTNAEEARSEVKEMLIKVSSIHEDKRFVAGAVVLVDSDGGVWISTRGKGNRALLLGAVADLQWSLGRDGEG